jgi:hypothetical protein
MYYYSDKMSDKYLVEIRNAYIILVGGTERKIAPGRYRYKYNIFLRKFGFTAWTEFSWFRVSQSDGIL